MSFLSHPNLRIFSLFHRYRTEKKENKKSQIFDQKLSTKRLQPPRISARSGCIQPNQQKKTPPE
jgi:hypothetical protein